MLANILVVYVSNGYLFYNLTYLELMPEYICPPGFVPKCDNVAHCANPDTIYINYDSTRTLDNWVPRLGLECKKIISEDYRWQFC